MYKLSTYNHYIRYNDHVLYFNTLSLSSFLVSPTEHKQLKEKLSDPITFELASPSVFAQFKEWGFLVEEGIEEIGEVRHRHTLKIHNKSQIHLLIKLSNNDLNKVDRVDIEKMVAQLKLHLMVCISNPDTKELCLEWCADSDEYYKKVMLPIIVFSKQECEVRNVKFVSQLNIKTLKTGKNNTLQLANYVNAMWADVSFVASRNGSDFPDKSIVKLSKLKQLLSNLKGILSVNPNLHFSFNIYIKKGSKRNEISSILDLIPSFARTNISLNMFSVSDDGSVRAEQPALRATIPLDSQWRIMDESKVMSYSVDMNGGVHFGRYVSADHSRCIGQLDSNGNVIYDRVKQGHYYGLAWFENERCAKCKYLPMFMQLCNLKVLYYGNTNHIACPIADGTIRPEETIVRFFEHKESVQ